MLLNASEKRDGQFETRSCGEEIYRGAARHQFGRFSFVWPKFNWCRMINGRARL